MEYIFFGGAFDPPHVDHINKAIQVLDATGCKSLYFMPTYKHVWGKNMVDVNHRKNMLRLSIKDSGDKRLWLNLYEIAEKIEAPTIDVLKGMFNSPLWCGDTTPTNSAYLIGIDQAVLMHKWNRWEELINFIPFIVMSRGLACISNIVESGCDWFAKPPHRWMEIGGTGIASSRIRDEISKGYINPKYLTPSTLAYIKDNKLYGKWNRMSTY